MEYTQWPEWTTYEVLEKSIVWYGKENVLAHILYEMTFFGCDEEETEKRIMYENTIIAERIANSEDNAGDYLTLEEVRKKLGIVDNRTETEKDNDFKREQEIFNKNESIYKQLLGR